MDKDPRHGGCWLYTGFRKWDGYGWLNRHVEGKPRFLTAHRYAWILAHGVPPAGEHIMHKCDNPPCCNPAHLQLGSHQDNMADSKRKLRHSFGERARNNKLTYAQVREIRRLYDNEGWDKERIAAKFGSSPRNIWFVVTRRTWKIDAPSPVLHPERVRPRRQA